VVLGECVDERDDALVMRVSTWAVLGQRVDEREDALVMKESTPVVLGERVDEREDALVMRWAGRWCSESASTSERARW
jgi:hypothetical protein